MSNQGAASSKAESLDATLRARAQRVVPGGMWGHLNAARLPEGYPQFFASAEGCRIRDVDGREYIDFMCSWGPILLGHQHPEVQAAATAQAARGDCLNGPGEVMVELAEDLVGMVPHADWAMFQKNGGDATTACVTIARAGTGRRKILVAKGSYHGALPWCSPSVAGVTTEDRAHLLQFEYNNVASLRTAVAEAGNDLAAIVVTAFRHDIGRDLELPAVEFARAVRQACDNADAALIIDEVRAGVRLDTRGSWETFGVRPDLCAWSKAIANGYALAAVTGNDRFREPATRVFLTGSFWCSAVAMAAARATLRIARETNVPARIQATGTMLRNGLASLARQHDVSVRQSGPPQMPLMLFDDDPQFRKGRAFCATALRHGAFFHPTHNMFLSAAHQPSDIERALDAAAHGFKAARELDVNRR